MVLKLRIKDFSIDEKPRERLARYGVSALSNSELLAIILSKGTKNKNVLDLSKEILSKYNLIELSHINLGDLSKTKGIGIAKACQILACFELGRRSSNFKPEEKNTITCASEVFNLLNPRLRGIKQEYFIGLYLDTRKKILKEQTLFIGSLDSTVIHPREILKVAVLESAAAIIIVHNHPSGDPTPSNEDLVITRQISNSCRELAIPLLDHIIIGYDNFTSIREIKEMNDIF